MIGLFSRANLGPPSTMTAATTSNIKTPMQARRRRKLLFMVALVGLVICCWPCLSTMKMDMDGLQECPTYKTSLLSNVSQTDPVQMDTQQATTTTTTTTTTTDQCRQLFSRLNNPDELALLTSTKNPDISDHLEACQIYFNDNNQHLQDNVSIKDYILTALIAKMHSQTYSDAYAHHYDTHEELKLAAGPQVDQELCLSQLEHLMQRARRQAREKYNSRDLNLYQLLDTFGHVSSGVLVGKAFFEGMYHECLRLKLDLPGETKNQHQESTGSTKYCVASLKMSNWRRIDEHDLIGFKFGLCLPKSCDSLNYKNKYELVMDLLMLQAREMEMGNEVKLQGLYCLPDEDSPLRSVARSPATLVTLIGLAVWLTLLAYATYQYEVFKREKSIASSLSSMSKFGLSSGMHLERAKDQTTAAAPAATTTTTEEVSSKVRLFKLLSITENLNSLFDTTKSSSLMDAAKTATSSKEDSTDSCQQVLTTTTTTTPPSLEERKIVDLRCIEGIKVVAMCYVITGHVLMCISGIMNNGRETSDNSSVSFCLANLVPAFAVNTFFTITAILTCYLMLKQNSAAQSLMMKPTKWLAFIIYRYLRIMPMYALVVLYMKTLAKFAGSGPLWDYGTSSLSQRKACQQESWLWTLLFGANFLPPLDHCIPSAWYLANDFQFFIITPIFLIMLNKRPLLGQWILGLASIFCYLAGIHSIWASDIEDVRPIATFAPHGFKTFISHFSFNYTRPQYRLPAYLIGLLIGYRMYVYEENQIKYFAEIEKDKSSMNPAEQQTPSPPPDWPDYFKRYAIPYCFAHIILCCLTPFIGSRLPFNKIGAKIMFSFVANTYHIVFSLSIGIYVLLATTGHGNRRLNRLLAAPFWKPLARLSLCAVLINVEVINYIMQTNSKLHYLTNQYHLSMNILCILSTYLVSVVVCVLFEAPIRGALNNLMFQLISKLGHKQKASKLCQ